MKFSISNMEKSMVVPAHCNHVSCTPASFVTRFKAARTVSCSDLRIIIFIIFKFAQDRCPSWPARRWWCLISWFQVLVERGQGRHNCNGNDQECQLWNPDFTGRHCQLHQMLIMYRSCRSRTNLFLWKAAHHSPTMGVASPGLAPSTFLADEPHMYTHATAHLWKPTPHKSMKNYLSSFMLSMTSPKNVWNTGWNDGWGGQVM